MFEKSWPGGFPDIIIKTMNTMAVTCKNLKVPVVDVKMFATETIYIERAKGL